MRATGLRLGLRHPQLENAQPSRGVAAPRLLAMPTPKATFARNNWVGPAPTQHKLGLPILGEVATDTRRLRRLATGIRRADRRESRSVVRCQVRAAHRWESKERFPARRELNGLSQRLFGRNAVPIRLSGRPTSQGTAGGGGDCDDDFAYAAVTGAQTPISVTPRSEIACANRSMRPRSICGDSSIRSGMEIASGSRNWSGCAAIAP